MTIESWLFFSSIAFIATISPGPAVLLVTTHSIAYGAKSSLATMSGNVTGLLIMSALSVLGLSTIILYSSVVFMVVKYIGAVYLIFLGIRLWMYGFGESRNGRLNGNGDTDRPRFSKLYTRGLLVALSNPKAIAFTTALFPQFIDHTQSVIPQFIILVATFMVLSFLCLLGFAIVTARAGNSMQNSVASSFLSKLFGALFVVSGLFLATATQKG